MIGFSFCRRNHGPFLKRIPRSMWFATAAGNRHRQLHVKGRWPKLGQWVSRMYCHRTCGIVLSSLQPSQGDEEIGKLKSWSNNGSEGWDLGYQWCVQMRGKSSISRSTRHGSPRASPCWACLREHQYRIYSQNKSHSIAWSWSFCQQQGCLTWFGHVIHTWAFCAAYESHWEEHFNMEVNWLANGLLLSTPMKRGTFAPDSS